MANKKLLVVALGGNAIKQADEQGTTEEQFLNIRKTAKSLFEIIKKGEYKVLVTHGNGPQVGSLLIQQEAAAGEVPAQAMPVVGAMTQGQIGYMLVQELENLLIKNGMATVPVACIVNQVKVDKNDPAFKPENASKPVGPFYTEEEAKKLAAERENYIVKQVKPTGDRCWRRVVASPEPIANMEIGAIKVMLDNRIVVIASGGGGIPVYEDENGELKGVPAVIDKDAAGELLAELVKADMFMILTDVEKAKLNFGKPDEKDIDKLTIMEAEKYFEEGHFLKGSMGPKIASCVKFVKNTGNPAFVTSLEKAVEALEGTSGTQIVQ